MCKPVENILKHNGIKADNKLEYNIFLWVFWPIPILWLKQHAGSLRSPHFTWCVTHGSSSVRLEFNSPRTFLRSVHLRLMHQMHQIHLPRASASGTPHYLQTQRRFLWKLVLIHPWRSTTARYRQFLRSTRMSNPTLTSSVLSTSSIQQR